MIGCAQDEWVGFISKVLPEVNGIFRHYIKEPFEWKSFKSALGEFRGYGVGAPFVICYFGSEVLDERWGLSSYSYRLPLRVVCCCENREKLDDALKRLQKGLRSEEFQFFQLVGSSELDLYRPDRDAGIVGLCLGGLSLEILVSSKD